MNQKSIIKREADVPAYRLFSKSSMFEDYKACPHCGQNDIPFKRGVCLRCCHQVGDIRYVKDPKEYVRTNYGNVKLGIREVYQGLDEMEIPD